MKFTVGGLAVFLTVGPMIARTLEVSEGPFRQITFAEAEKTAAKENKIVFVDFFTTWCGPCKELDKTTWKDADVVKLLADKTVALRIDAEQETALATKYHIGAYPTLLLLKADGTEIDRLVGYRDSSAFTLEFKDALTGKNSVARAQERVAKEQAEGDLEKVVQARYEEAQALADSGKYEAALREYLWCYDDGMLRAPGFRGVRVSFLVSKIQRLGLQYPPAKTALIERRDRALADVEAGKNILSANDLAALNGVMGEDEKTLAVFNGLPPKDPRRAAMIGSVYPMLIKAHRYDEAYDARGLGLMLSTFELGAAQLRSAGKDSPQAALYRRFIERHAVSDIEVLLGTHHLAEATELRDKLLSIDSSPETIVGLQNAVIATGNPQFKVQGNSP